MKQGALDISKGTLCALQEEDKATLSVGIAIAPQQIANSMGLCLIRQRRWTTGAKQPSLGCLQLQWLTGSCSERL